MVWQFDDEIEGVESDPVAGMTNSRQENEGRDGSASEAGMDVPRSFNAMDMYLRMRWTHLFVRVFVLPAEQNMFEMFERDNIPYALRRGGRQAST